MPSLFRLLNAVAFVKFTKDFVKLNAYTVINMAH